MSVPSSEGRPSTSSMPSAASSPTLNSRYSGQYADNGEGSSSQRPSLAGSRQNSGGRLTRQEEHSQSSGSPLSVDAIGERDFAQRKQRNRKSGGFLLDSAFHSGSRARRSHNGGREADAKDKQSSHDSHRNDRGERVEKHHVAYGTANSSPLSREVRMTDAGGADTERRVDSVNTEEHGAHGIQVGKMRTGALEVPSTAHERGQIPEATTPRSAFDPNQIVHMALNLSESRRRNLNAGQLLTPQARVPSGTHRDGSFHSPGTGSGHLKQYFNEQRRVSRNISPFGDKGSPGPGRHMSMSMQRRGSMLAQGQQYTPSEASMRRADKFRAFIELRVEYLRLLEFLPPLKPDSSAPGNFVVMANNVPGSPHAQLTRMPSHINSQYELGRPYNPLQFLRNRRSRARERKAFDHQPEEFADVQEVRKWIDRVEEAVQSPSYRRLDGVALPRYHEDHGSAAEPPKPARPNKVWIFTIEELLADAHWLEHGDNKTIVEDRHGRKIFPPKEPQKQDFLQLRSSKEYPEARRKSWVEGLAGVADNHNTTGDESEGLSERGRKRRILPTFRAESPKHKKHIWSGSKQAGSHTDSSDSDSDTHKRRSRKTQRIVDGDNDTGPLALRMKQLMEREAKETGTAQTPILFTPDTPNKWGQDRAEEHEEFTRSSFEASASANGSTRMTPIDLGLKLPPKQRTDPELSKDPSKEYRSSFEEFDSTAPSTPIHQRHYPHIDGDSPPPSRAGSERKKFKKSKLDFLRSEESKANRLEHQFRPGSADSDKKQSYRNASEEIEEGTGIGSAIWAAPGAVKNFLGHRKNDSVSSLPSPVKDNRRDVKEPPSAVTRFIKGVKNEGSKVGEFIFRKDRPADDSDTDLAEDQPIVVDSETDEDFGSLRRRRRPNLGRSTTAETAGSVTSKKTSGYHLELPSFRSSYQSKIDEDSDSQLSDHHITRQARETAKNRSPRFDKLAPPPIDLSRISTATSISPSPSQDRISQLLARPGGVGHAGLPVTALAKDKASQDSSERRSSSRPTLEGKRHWSITDDKDHVLSRKTTSSIISSSEIASVRALFLCSGIKAKEINRRALEVREHPPSFLIRAAKSAKADLYGVSRKEEHVLAAHILVNSFEASTQALHHSANAFRESKVVELTSMINGLKDKVDAELFTRVRNSGDQAVKMTSWVSADAPLTVKQITDDIDHMLRMRRRRTRWIRRVGWTTLEWMLLGFMWCAWLVVTLVRVVVRVVGVAWRVSKWLLWL
ncbi:hypothetical protein N0V90_013162 [Kalmusia sp. IMI 367209]|nr:hypothetical protein N0V90_013162 [Kalmusia sp. IMI 367209]